MVVGVLAWIAAATWLWAQPTNINILTNGVGGVGQLVLGVGAANPILMVRNAGAPTNGTAGTQAGRAYPGSALFDITNKHLYINENTTASPTWVRQDDQRVSFVASNNAAVLDTHFFIADRAYTVTRIDAIHTTAGTDAGAVTLQPRKATGVQAPATGVVLTTATHNLKGTVETVTNFTLTATSADLDLAAGNRLSVDITGTATTVAGVVVTVTVKRK